MEKVVAAKESVGRASKKKEQTRGHYIPPQRSLWGRLIVKFGEVLTRTRARWLVEGREHIPPNEPYVIAANHVSFIDALWIFCSLPAKHYRKTCALIGADLQSDYGLLGKLMTIAARAIPVDRKGNGSARSLIVAKNALAAGNNILIHPEGTRSTDGRLGLFQTGAAYLGYKYDAPVLPVYIHGGHAIWPRGQRFPLFKDPESGKKKILRIIFGPCFYGRNYKSVKDMNTAMYQRFLKLQQEIGY